MRNKILIALVFSLLLASCGRSPIFESDFKGEQGEACCVVQTYITAVANGNSSKTFEFESPYLWPGLDEKLYNVMRAKNPDFASLVGKSSFKFTQCSVQEGWGLYGRTYDLAYIIAVEASWNSELTQDEKRIADVVGKGPFLTVATKMDGQWKLMPFFGPELFEIKEAEKAYIVYLDAIKSEQFSKTYDFTPTDLLSGANREQVEREWKNNNGKGIAEFLKKLGLKPTAGRIEFGVNHNGRTYPYGVTFNLFMNIDQMSYQGNDALIKMIADDWTTGKNTTVTMVYEDGWKVVAENPLF